MQRLPLEAYRELQKSLAELDARAKPLRDELEEATNRASTTAAATTLLKGKLDQIQAEYDAACEKLKEEEQDMERIKTELAPYRAERDAIVEESDQVAKDIETERAFIKSRMEELCMDFPDFVDAFEETVRSVKRRRSEATSPTASSSPPPTSLLALPPAPPIPVFEFTYDGKMVMWTKVMNARIKNNVPKGHGENTFFPFIYRDVNPHRPVGISLRHHAVAPENAVCPLCAENIPVGTPCCFTDNCSRHMYHMRCRAYLAVLFGKHVPERASSRIICIASYTYVGEMCGM